jgi:hypothetical protein
MTDPALRHDAQPPGAPVANLAAFSAPARHNRAWADGFSSRQTNVIAGVQALAFRANAAQIQDPAGLGGGLSVAVGPTEAVTLAKTRARRARPGPGVGGLGKRRVG